MYLLYTFLYDIALPIYGSLLYAQLALRVASVDTALLLCAVHSPSRHALAIGYLRFLLM